VAVRDLARVFRKRVAGRPAEFIALVQQVGRLEAATKRIVLKDQRSYPEHEEMKVLAGRVEAGVLTFPVLQEVKAAIPTEGVAIADLVKVFKTRLEDRTTEFIALVQQAGRQDGMTGKIVPKDQRSYRRYDNMQELAGDLAVRRYRDGFYWVLLAAIESSMRV